MRILNVCETAHGGVGAYMGYLSRMEDRGYDMHFLMPRQDADFPGTRMTVHGFDRPGRSVAATRDMVRNFGTLLNTLRPDLCFFHSTFALAALARLRLHHHACPSLYCPHGWALPNYAPGSAKAAVVRAVEGRLCGLADRVVCVSHNEAAIARDMNYRGAHVVVENAVPPPIEAARSDRFADEGPDVLNLLFVGRLDRQKGFDLLQDALAQCPRADLRLHVVGGTVRDGTAMGDLDPRIRMVGWVKASDIDHFYRSADALIVPSRWEGLPLVIPEAFRNGTPVYCSRESGMESLVEAGTTGNSFPLDVVALVSILNGLDKKVLHGMRDASRAVYARRFHVDRMLAHLDDIFQELAGAR